MDPDIFGTAEAKDFKFGVRIATRSNFDGMQKLGQRGHD